MDGGRIMGHRYYEKCNQINSLIELYEEYEKARSGKDQMEAVIDILSALKRIRNVEVDNDY